MVRSTRTTEAGNGTDGKTERMLNDRSNSFMDEKRERADSNNYRRESLSSGDLEDIAIWINGDSMTDQCPKGVH
jgi:hypothetical protein